MKLKEIKIKSKSSSRFKKKKLKADSDGTRCKGMFTIKFCTFLLWSYLMNLSIERKIKEKQPQIVIHPKEHDKGFSNFSKLSRNYESKTNGFCQNSCIKVSNWTEILKKITDKISFNINVFLMIILCFWCNNYTYSQLNSGN